MSKSSYFTGQPVYSQVINLLDKSEIIKISCQIKGSEAYVKRFDGYQYLIVMLFGVLNHFDSLRELELGMKAEANKLEHQYRIWEDAIAKAVSNSPRNLLFLTKGAYF